MQIDDIIKKLDFIGEFTTNNVKFHRKIETFRILPSKINPRWIIPLKDRNLIISSLAIYQPSTLRARIIKRIAILIARCGFSKIAIRNRIYYHRNDDFMKRIFQKDNLHYAIFTGTEGCHRKITVQVMDRLGSILGYVKISDNKKVNKLLKNEAAMLRDLLKLEVKNGLFPEVLYQGNVNGKTILVLDTHKSINSKFSSRLSDSYIPFLAEVFQKTAKSMVFKKSDYAIGLKKRMTLLNNSLTGIWRDRLEKAIDYLDQGIGNVTLPFGLCHRDFTPWNTFFHNSKLYVFDWEYAKRNYPPLIDIFHFIIQDGILVQKLTPEKLFEGISKNQKLINDYIESIGISMDLINYLLVCYLLDIHLLYVEREGGKIKGELLKKHEIWRKMIDLIVEEKIRI